MVEFLNDLGANTQYTKVNATRVPIKKSQVRAKLKLAVSKLPRIGPIQKPRGRDSIVKRERRSERLGAS